MTSINKNGARGVSPKDAVQVFVFADQSKSELNTKKLTPRPAPSSGHASPRAAARGGRGRP
jgi:hypothetical protein